MNPVSKALGRVKWAEAEHALSLADAFNDASTAAGIINENDIATKWANRANEERQRASNLKADARKLGYFEKPSREDTSIPLQ
jgi:hypothetical protein